MTPRRLFARLSVGLVLIGPAGGCGGAPDPVRVKAGIDALTFDPVPVLHPGDTVRWTNHDLVPHTVSLRDGDAIGPESGTLGNGEAWSWVVPDDAPQEVEIMCRFHPTMTRRLRVERP